MAHLMPRKGEPCALPDWHKGRHRSFESAGRERERKREDQRERNRKTRGWYDADGMATSEDVRRLFSDWQL